MESSRQRDEYGASAVEYGLLVVAVAAVIVVVLMALGGVVVSMFSGTCTGVDAQVTNSVSC
jgi:pilus assembly protein Flp/PilA